MSSSQEDESTLEFTKDKNKHKGPFRVGRWSHDKLNSHPSLFSHHSSNSPVKFAFNSQSFAYRYCSPITWIFLGENQISEQKRYVLTYRKSSIKPALGGAYFFFFLSQTRLGGGCLFEGEDYLISKEGIDSL